MWSARRAVQPTMVLAAARRVTCLPRRRLVTVSRGDVTTAGRESRDGTGRRRGGGYRSNPGRDHEEVLEVLAVNLAWPVIREGVQQVPL